jgi:hypothetical protein
MPFGTGAAGAKRPGLHRARRYSRHNGTAQPLTAGRRSYGLRALIHTAASSDCFLEGFRQLLRVFEQLPYHGHDVEQAFRTAPVVRLVLGSEPRMNRRLVFPDLVFASRILPVSHALLCARESCYWQAFQPSGRPMFDKTQIPPDTAMFEHIDAINQSINRVRSALKDNVEMDPLDDVSMVRGQAEIFFQSHLRRALAFLDGGKHALDAGYGLLALTAIRCLYESAACIHDFCNHVIKLVDAGNVPDAVRLAHQRSLAQRFEVKAENTDDYDYTAVNILKQIDALNKVVPQARRDYDQLSEFVHPNAHGSVLYFIQTGPDDIVNFSAPVDERTPILGLFLGGASLFGLVESDLWRFTSSILGLLERGLQAKIDDYEARKAAGTLSQ